MKPIDPLEVQHKMERRDACALVDVANEHAYRETHLPGALNIPLDEHFEATAQRLLPDRELEVVVCEGCVAGSSRAYAAGKILEQLGYKFVSTYGEFGDTERQESQTEPLPGVEPPKNTVDKDGWDSFPASDPPGNY